MLKGALAACFVALGGAAQLASAADATQLLAPGFCPVGPTVGATEIAQGATGVLIRFAACEEVGRGGGAETYRHRGRVVRLGGVSVLETGDAGNRDDGPISVKTDMELDSLGAQRWRDLNTVWGRRAIEDEAAALGPGDSANLGVLEADARFQLSAELTRDPDRGEVEVRMRATSTWPDQVIMRELVMPYDSADTLRFMRASLRASAAADRILLSRRD